MNVLKAIKVAEIRKKLSIIPAKLIIAAVLAVAIYWDWDKGIEAVWPNIQADPKKYATMFAICYGLVSYVRFFIGLMHHWILGVIVAAIVAAVTVTQVAKLGPQQLHIALIIMLVGGPVFDVINFIRYKALKSEVIHAEESRMEESYDEGYDDGFLSGIRASRRNERRYLEEEYRREYEEELEDYRRERLGRRDRYDRYEEYEDYDDNYDEGYDEDGYEDYDEIEDEGYGEPRFEDTGRRKAAIPGNSENAAGFFADCKTPGEIKRRYHDLCKVYHPDTGNGSSEIFYRIKEEYDKLRV